MKGAASAPTARARGPGASRSLEQPATRAAPQRLAAAVLGRLDLLATAGVAERLADAAEGLRELGGNDEDLVRIPFGERRQHLDVFVAQELPRRVALVDGAEDGVDRLRF